MFDVKFSLFLILHFMTLFRRRIVMYTPQLDDLDVVLLKWNLNQRIIIAILIKYSISSIQSRIL